MTRIEGLVLLLMLLESVELLVVAFLAWRLRECTGELQAIRRGLSSLSPTFNRRLEESGTRVVVPERWEDELSSPESEG